MFKKTHVRVYQRYGTEGGGILRALLEEEGFREDDHLEGELRAVIYDGSQLHMPYLDWATTFDWEEGDSTVELGKHKDHSGGNTNGITDELGEPSACCAHCGDEMDEDESTYVEGLGDVCEHCIDHHFTNAWTGRNQEWVQNNSESIYRCEDDDEYYTDDGISWHDLVFDKGGNLRSPHNVVWVESIDEYCDPDETFEDEEGETRHASEVTLDWWLRDGVLSEDEPDQDEDEEQWVQIGTMLFAQLWSVKPDRWHNAIVGLFDNYDVTIRVRGEFKRLVRTQYGNWKPGWEDKAAQFGVTYDERDKPVIHGQLNLDMLLAA
jgi:hypothetical protein